MLLDDIKGLLLTVCPNIFRMDMPDDPDNIMCLYLTGGFAPTFSFDGRTYEQPSFQVAVRHKSADTAVLWAEQVKDILTPIQNTTINTTHYLDITQTSDIMPLGRDSRGRSKFAVNFYAKTQRMV